MPTNSRLRGRFFSVLIAILFALLPLVAAMGETGHQSSPAPTLCQISEGLFGAKAGNDKKAAALSFVQSAVGATDAIANKNIIDPNKFQDGLGKVIDGVVACLNASVWANK
jgi:hypothetical protein